MDVQVGDEPHGKDYNMNLFFCHGLTRMKRKE